MLITEGQLRLIIREELIREVDESPVLWWDLRGVVTNHSRCYLWPYISIHEARMRITESKLRQIISRVIQETPQQVLSPQFRRWFGNSVAVDLSGNPIKLYHGSGDVFDSFRPSAYGTYGPGIYLTAVQDMASRYATVRRSDSLKLQPSVYVV